MVGLTTEQRRMLIDKLPDAANLAWGALVLGQLLGGQQFSIALATLGVGLWAGLVTFAFVLAGGKEG